MNSSFEILKSTENVKSRGLDRVRNENLFPQTTLSAKIVEKFTKVSKIGFSVECFTAGFFAYFYQKTSKFVSLGGRLVTRHQIQTFQGFS